MKTEAPFNKLSCHQFNMMHFHLHLLFLHFLEQQSFPFLHTSPLVEHIIEDLEAVMLVGTGVGELATRAGNGFGGGGGGERWGTTCANIATSWNVVEYVPTKVNKLAPVRQSLACVPLMQFDGKSSMLPAPAILSSFWPKELYCSKGIGGPFLLPETWWTNPVADRKGEPDGCICTVSLICTSQTTAPLLPGVVKLALRMTVALDSIKTIKFSLIAVTDSSNVLRLMIGVSTMTEVNALLGKLVRRLLPVSPYPSFGDSSSGEFTRMISQVPMLCFISLDL